ncbi:hypothetical protein AALB47_20960 [Lachnospiraceae bacterium 54-11]
MKKGYREWKGEYPDRYAAIFQQCRSPPEILKFIKVRILEGAHAGR